MGGEARKQQLGPEGYARMGREGGNARKDRSEREDKSSRRNEGSEE